jgi:hypothetical protein
MFLEVMHVSLQFEAVSVGLYAGSGGEQHSFESHTLRLAVRVLGIALAVSNHKN